MGRGSGFSPEAAAADDNSAEKVPLPFPDRIKSTDDESDNTSSFGCFCKFHSVVFSIIQAKFPPWSSNAGRHFPDADLSLRIVAGLWVSQGILLNSCLKSQSSRLLGFKRKSRILIITCPSLFRHKRPPSPTTIIFLNESSIWHNGRFSCSIFSSSYILKAD